MANVSSSIGISKYPKLRFPGFDDPWERTPFSNLYRYVSEKNDGSFSVEQIISVANMYFKADARITDKDYLRTYNVFKFGDIAFEGNKNKNFAYGRFVENTIGDGIVSHVFVVFRPVNESHNLEYWKYDINNENVMGRILARCTKKTTMMTNLVASDFLAQTIYCPSLDEQAHIATFLSLIDERIRKQEELIEAIGKYKRGVVSAILTHHIKFVDDNGETYPEWTSCALQDVVEFLDGQRKPLESADRAKRQGSYPYYGASGIIDYVDDYIFDEPLILLGEDGANIINRSTPLCFIATGKYWVNNHAHVMRPKHGHNIKFLCELLESLDYTRYNTGTAQPKLNQKKCREIELIMPIYEEQCRIAEFLSSLDQKAEREQTNLEFLLVLKRGLLQQLFI